MSLHHHVMFLSRAFGLRTPLHALRPQARQFSSTSARCLPQCLPEARRLPIQQAWRGIQRRAESTAARKSRSGYRYGPEVNVYRYGTLATTFVGVIRLSTIIIFIFGALIYFPAYTYSYFRPVAKTSDKEQEVKWYIPPLFLIGSTVPMLAAFFVFAPWVHQIHISIPARARKSREDLLRWARHIPRDTRVSISVIRASFSPTVQRAAFEELTRLPPSFTRLTNLEIRRNDNYIHELENHKRAQRSPIMEELAHRVYGRLFVNRDQKQDKSAAPGVWDIIWEQIPTAAEKEVEMRMLEQRRLADKPPGPRVKPSRPKQ